MRKKDVNNIKRNLSKGKHLKICILDNNSIEFLNHVYDEVSPEKIFSPYDYILIPNWVYLFLLNQMTY